MLCNPFSKTAKTSFLVCIYRSIIRNCYIFLLIQKKRAISSAVFLLDSKLGTLRQQLYESELFIYSSIYAYHYVLLLFL